jgi:hypothetical protein
VEWGVSTRWLKLGKFMFSVLSRSVLSVPVKINSQLIFLIFKVFVIFCEFLKVFLEKFLSILLWSLGLQISPNAFLRAWLSFVFYLRFFLKIKCCTVCGPVITGPHIVY